MKVVITGSHFSPAYAVIKKSKWKVAVIGRRYALTNSDKESYEYKLCRTKKIPFLVLDVPRFSRVHPVKSVFSSLSLTKSIVKARKMIKEINPDAVVSFGGYTSLPVVIAASLLRKPVLIHEQTLGAGFANKIASIFAKKVLLSFSSSRPYFPKRKIVVTGNPIREDILNKDAKPSVIDTNRPIIYVTGGSTGSAAINDLIVKILPSLSLYFVIHQRGASEVEIDKKTSDYYSKDYFAPKEVGWIMRNASLVISRSGINTVTEILYLGVPAIFIPLPYGQKNEQIKNAKYAEKHGRTIYFMQGKITPEILLKAIRGMIKKGKSKQISEEVIKHEKAADNIINETEKLYKKIKKGKRQG